MSTFSFRCHIEGIRIVTHDWRPFTREDTRMHIHIMFRCNNDVFIITRLKDELPFFPTIMMIFSLDDGSLRPGGALGTSMPSEGLEIVTFVARMHHKTIREYSS